MYFRHIVPFLALAAAGCVHVLPPPEPPGPFNPPPVKAPVADGLGRVYVEVVDGATPVRVVHPIGLGLILGDDQLFEAQALETEQACTTPCVLDLPLGRHFFAFPVRGSREVELEPVYAGPRPSIYRRTLGWKQSGGAGLVLGILGTTFGGMSLATGATLYPVGLANDSRGLTTAGEITLAAGAVLTAFGIWGIVHDPTIEQPGAGAQYDLP